MKRGVLPLYLLIGFSLFAIGLLIASENSSPTGLQALNLPPNLLSETVETDGTNAAIDLATLFFDPEGDALSFSTDDPSAQISGTTLTFTAPADAGSEYTATITVSDGTNTIAKPITFTGITALEQTTLLNDPPASEPDNSSAPVQETLADILPEGAIYLPQDSEQDAQTISSDTPFRGTILIPATPRTQNAANENGTGISAYPCAPAPPGLIAWWPGEGTGDDISGNGHHGTLNGVTFVGGIVGSRFNLTGATSSNVSVPHAVALNPAEMTVMGWVRLRIGSTVQGRPYQKTDSLEDGYYSRLSGAGTFNMHYGNGSGGFVRDPSTGVGGTFSSLGTLVLGGDVFFASTIDATDGSRLDFNGLASTLFDNNDTIITEYSPAATPFVIGSQINGSMDEIRIFDNALTPSQINVQYLTDVNGAGMCRDVCGDGFLEPTEQCDDNNLANGDGCSSTCEFEDGFCFSVEWNGTTVVLDTDITNATGDCININSQDVTIDCNGHTIIGDGTGYGVGAGSFNNLIVRNCHLVNFSTGIFFSGGVNSNVHAINNTIDGELALDGITDDGGDTRQTVGNTINVTGTAISANSLPSTSVNITYNNITAFDGVTATDIDDSLIAHNNITSIGDYGISLQNGAENNSLRNNSIIGGGVAGLSIAGAQIVDSFFTETLRGGEWYNWGKRHYSMFPETHEVSVQFPDDFGEYKVRLRHDSTWIDAAHMDSVFLRVNGTLVPPITAVDLNTSENILYKVNATDLDVADVFKHTVEATWNGIEPGTYPVVMHGREEAAETTRTPLYSPLGARFGEYHNYTLLGEGAPLVDGQITFADGYGAPDFITHWETATGHPEADNVWYLTSDAENLFVGFEFTSDNTDDYGKDWAAVFVNKGQDKKTFNISLNQTTYGNSSWSYTPTVNYQHKVFEFRIPLSEINASIGDILAVSFAAYGTGGGPVPSTGNFIINTSVSHTGRGIEVEDSTGNTFIDTNITNITDTALNVLDGADINTFTNTTIIDSATGITVRNSDGNNFTNTRLQNMTLEGITFENSLTNRFINLNLSGNDTWLIIDVASTDNTLTGAKFENTTAGSITLFSALTLPAGVIVNQTNFHIFNNRAFINTTEIPAFNVSGRVALTTNLTDPRPQVDFEDDGSFNNCLNAICFFESYSDDLYTFNVSHFTTYQVTNTTISNTSPSVTTPDIAPDPASGSDVLNASCVFTDDDLDLGTLTFNWTVNSVLVNSTGYGVSNGTNVTDYLYPGSYGLGDNVTVFCYAIDAQNAATAVNNDSIIISLNAHPSIAQVVLNSSDGSGAALDIASNNENLTAIIVNAFDADNDSVQNITDWRVNGTSLAVLNMPFETNVSTTTSRAIRDYSTYENNGTLGNGTPSAAPVWNANGKVGGYYAFDGSDDVIVLNNSASLDIDNETISFGGWFRTSGTASFSSILNKASPTSPFEGYNLAVHSDNTLRCDFLVSFPGEWTVVLSTASVEDGQWHHAVCSWNGTHVKIHVDGRLNNSAAYTQGISPSNQDAVIGNDPGTAGRFFTGDIDEVFVMNRALSDSQIYQLYLDGNNSNHSLTWVSNETTAGDIWSVAVTPNDGMNASDGTTVISNDVTISANNEPSIAQVVLNSSSGNGELGTAGPDENLTVQIINATDFNNDPVQNITDWRLGGSSIMTLNLPFESNISNTSTGRIRSYTTDSVNGTLGNGVDSQAPAWTEFGQVGGAYEYDGTDDQIIVDFNAPIGPYSITAWVRHNGTLSGFEVIMEFGDDSPFFGADGGALALYPILSGGTIPPDQWTFVAFTYDGTDSTLYINDTVVDSATADPPDTGVELGIGYHGTDTPWTGAIDEVRIFNRSLSQAQIAQLYSEGLQGLHMTNLTSNETTLGDVWTVAATPNDQHPNTDGITVLSNQVTISNTIPCPGIITADLTLTTNINGTNASGNCIETSTPGITIDCQGYTMIGDNASIAIYVNADNVTTENCNLIYWDNGIYYDTTNNGLIQNNTANESLSNGIRVHISNGTSVLHNRVNNSLGGGGIFMSSSLFSTTVNNTIYNNTVESDAGNCLAVSGYPNPAQGLFQDNTVFNCGSTLSIDAVGTGIVENLTAYNSSTISVSGGATGTFTNVFMYGRGSFNAFDSNTLVNNLYISNSTGGLSLSVTGAFPSTGAETVQFTNVTVLSESPAWMNTGVFTSLGNSIANFTFGNNNGAVTWTGTYTLPDNVNVGDPLTGELGFNITYNHTQLNSTYLPFLNTSARVSIFGLPFTNPQALVDFEDDGTFVTCTAPQCENSTFTAGNLTFDVLSFTGYAASETVSACPLQVGTGTTLTENLTCEDIAINITAHNVDLDCAGYTVTYHTDGTIDVGFLEPGIIVDDKNNITIRNCILVNGNNSGDTAPGIGYAGNDSTIVNNTVITNGTGGFGISIDNTVSSTGFGGLNVTIQNNTIYANGTGAVGVYAGNSENVSVLDNIVVIAGSDSHTGIRYDSATNGTARNNTILINTTDCCNTGMFIDIEGGITLENNSVNINGTGFHNGIVLQETTANAIAGNTVVINGTTATESYGLDLRESTSTSVYNNAFVVSADAGLNRGIQVDGSASNNNTYTNNTIHVSGNQSFGLYLGFAINENTRNDNFYQTTITALSNGTRGIYFRADGYNLTRTIINSSPIWIYSESGNAENNITNTTFMTDNGNIQIRGNISVIDLFNISQERLNITFNNSFLNSTNLSLFNQSAIVTLNGLSFTDPQALVDLEDDGTFATCTGGADCDEVSYAGGIFVFNVSHFTSYAASETTVSAGSCTPASNITTCCNISTSGSYGLGGDFTADMLDTCINVTASDVDFDCRGFTFVAETAFELFEVSDFALRNCIINTSTTAIDVHTDNNSNLAFDNLTITPNNPAIFAEATLSGLSQNFTLSNSFFNMSTTAAAGLNLYDFDGFLVENNTLYGGGFGSPAIIGDSVRGIVRNNTLIDPFSGGGISIGANHSLVINNTLIGNLQSALQGGGENNTFINNFLVTNNLWINYDSAPDNNFTNTTFLNTSSGSIRLDNFTLPDTGTALISTVELDVHDNRSFVNTTNLTFANSSGIITLFNITFANPQPLIDVEDDGTYAICNPPECEELSYNGSTFIFNTTHFTSHASSETVNVTTCPLDVTTDVTLGTNITCNGTTVNILADNVVFDCAGYSLNHSLIDGETYGINVTNRNNITIRNCVIFAGDPTLTDVFDLFINDTNNSLVETTNTTLTESTSVSLQHSNNNTFTRLILSATSGTLLQTLNSSHNTFADSLHFGNTNLLASSNNVLRNISVNSSSGTGIFTQSNSHNNTIVNVSVSAEDFALEATDGSYHTIANSTFISFTDHAVRILTNDTNVRNITSASGTGFGFNLEFGARNNISDVWISSGDNWAFVTRDSARLNQITNVNIRSGGNFGAGIRFGNFGGPTAENNTFDNITLTINTSDSTEWFNVIEAHNNNTFTNLLFNASNGTILIINQTTLPLYNFQLNATHLNVSHNNSFLNSTNPNASWLNTTGQVTLTNLPFTDPSPLVDFEDDGSFATCSPPECDEVSYVGGVFVFNVSHFTSHAASETVNVSVCPLYVNTNTTLAVNISCPATAVIVNTSNVVLDCAGNHITYATNSSGYGINATSRTNVTIANCTLHAGNESDTTSSGLGIVSTTNSRAYNITSYANASMSITLSSSTSNNLSNMSLVTNATAVLETGSTGNIFDNISITPGAFGYWMNSGGSNNTVTRNTIDARRNGASGALVQDTNEQFINNYILADGRGIFFSSATQGLAQNNTVFTNSSSAIEISSSTNIIVTNNTLNTTIFNSAFFMQSSSENNITNNFASSTSGSYIQQFSTNNLYDNNRGTDGLFIVNSPGNRANNNNVSNIQLGNGNYNNLTNNRINLVQLSSGSSNNTFDLTTINSTTFWISSDSGSFENNWTQTNLTNANGSIYFPSQFILPASAQVTNPHTIIAANLTRVNSTNLSFLNTTAQILLNGLAFIDPRPAIDIEDDGTFIYCNPPECVEISYAGGTFVFNITHFTSYAVQENLTFVINVSAEKADSPDPIARGSQLSYTITLNNTGNATAQNVTVVENYPSGVVFVSGQPTPAGNDTFTVGSILPGGFFVINITVNVSNALANGTVLNNTVNITFANSSGENSTFNDSELTTVLGAPVLVSIKSDTPDPVVRGQQLNYSILINNTGDDTAFNVSLTETYPAGVSFVTAQPTPTGNGTFTIGTLAPNETFIVNITVTVGANVANGTLLNNSVNASWRNVSGQQAGVSDSELTTVLGIASITVVKTDTPDPVNNGSALSYTITVTNTGDEIAYNVTAVEGYPDNVTLTLTAPAPSAGNNTFSLGNLTPGASTTINITVTVHPNMTSGLLNNTVNVTFENLTGAVEQLSAFQATTVTTPGVPAAPAGGGGGGGSNFFRTANVTREQPAQVLPVTWPTVQQTTTPPAQQTPASTQPLTDEFSEPAPQEPLQTIQENAQPNETAQPAESSPLWTIALLALLAITLIAAAALIHQHTASRKTATQKPVPPLILHSTKKAKHSRGSPDLKKLDSDILELERTLRQFNRKSRR